MNTRQNMKRNISMDAQNDAPVKKIRTRKPLDTRYETPHPSLFSESQAYKLPSSVGSYLSPSKFSPIPKGSSTRYTHRRTSSTNLKENASITASYSPFPRKQPQNTKKYGKSRRSRRKRAAVPLESPFNSSGSASSASSPGTRPNISRLASQSATNLPDFVASPAKTRRPSAPTPPRLSDWKYFPTHTVSALDLCSPITDSHLDADLPPNAFLSFARPSSNHSQPDFNRPPSQLSMYDYNSAVTYDDKPMDIDNIDSANHDAFFMGVRGTSTPFKHLGSLNPHDRQVGGAMDHTALTRSALLQSIAGTETDTDCDSCSFDSDDEDMNSKRPNHFFRRLKLTSMNRSKTGNGCVTPDDSGDEKICPRSPWINDSLISPPKTIDWQLVPKHSENDAYKHTDDRCDVLMDGEERVPEHVLEGLFDKLILDHTALETGGNHDIICQDVKLQSVPLPFRTRSLDTTLPSTSILDHDAPCFVAPVTSAARRTRSGTIIPGTSADSTMVSAAPILLPRRTRSGTVVPGDVSVSALAGSDEPVAPTPSFRRNRSGTVVSISKTLAPPLPIKSVGAISTSNIPVVARRSRSGSIRASEGSSLNSVAGSSVGTALRSRMRSGSIVALGNTLANLPSQAAGIIKRTRSGTVVHAPSALAPMPGMKPTVEEATGAGAGVQPRNLTDGKPSNIDDTLIEDVEMAFLFEPAACDLKSAPITCISRSNSPCSERYDKPNSVDEPMVFASPTNSSPTHSVADTNTAPNTRSSSNGRLRARAKAAASKAKGLSKTLAGKGGARGKGLTGREAGAAALARARARAEQRALEEGSGNDDDSDDPLLLK